MNASSQPTPTSTFNHVQDGVHEAFQADGDDDYAIGCECANPALQIEMWGSEAVSQPLQRLS